MSGQGRPGDQLGATGDEQISAAARLQRAQHRAQRDHLNISLEEMQSDLHHFSSTIQRLHDHLRAAPQTDVVALTRTLESSQAIFTALETACGHLLALRNALRAPSLSQSLPLQSSPPSTPTPALPSFVPESRTLPSSTSPYLRPSPAANGSQETVALPTAEISPAEERAVHYVALSSPSRFISSGVWTHYNARGRRAADGERLSTEEEFPPQSEAQGDSLWYSIPPPPSSSSGDRLQPALPPRFWTPRTRLPPTQLDPTTPHQAPSSVVQFTRQPRASVPTTGPTSSSSSASSTDTNNDANSGGDSRGAGNDDLTSVNRAANRLFQRLSSIQETTRRLRERRWSNLPDRGLAEIQTLANAEIDPLDPIGPARRPDYYARLLRRRVLSTAPPPSAGADAGGDEENKENVEVALNANGDPIIPAVGVLVRHYGRKNSSSVTVVKEEAQRLGLGSTWDHGVPWPLPTRPRMRQNAHFELEVTLPRGSSLPVVCS